jgi:hypothetical protein
MSDTYAVIIGDHTRLIGTQGEAQAEYVKALAAYRPEFHDQIRLYHLVEVMVGDVSKRAWSERYGVTPLPEAAPMVLPGISTVTVVPETRTDTASEAVRADEGLSDLLRDRIAGLCRTLADKHATQYPNTLVRTTYGLGAYRANQRFVRIVMDNGQRSVHAFVDTTNGALIKAEGWKKPAKRGGGWASVGSLLNDADYERILDASDPFGGYLYAR